MPGFHSTRGGMFAVVTTGRSVILAAHPGRFFTGLSIGLPTWWLPRVERRGRGRCVGWLWASVYVGWRTREEHREWRARITREAADELAVRVSPPGSTIEP